MRSFSSASSSIATASTSTLPSSPIFASGASDASGAAALTGSELLLLLLLPSYSSFTFCKFFLLSAAFDEDAPGRPPMFCFCFWETASSPRLGAIEAPGALAAPGPAVRPPLARSLASRSRSRFLEVVVPPDDDTVPGRLLPLLLPAFARAFASCSSLVRLAIRSSLVRVVAKELDVPEERAIRSSLVRGADGKELDVPEERVDLRLLPGVSDTDEAPGVEGVPLGRRPLRLATTS
mmetsp:Transcript_10383/g.25102  ORF Transcript_10383/g.25102 Transcript_10383/m.25102 type:complete len:236 (-) Transcript_10383:264-971(-)